jgi:hypothetical protein
MRVTILGTGVGPASILDVDKALKIPMRIAVCPKFS